VIRRTDSWSAFYFCAVSGDRISANLGLRWSDVDLVARKASLVNFVKYHGRPGQRVLIEKFGKTTPGHTIDLDPRTLAILRDLKVRQRTELLSRSDRHRCPCEGRDCPLPGYHDRDLVFPQRDGNFRDPNKFRDLFQGAIRAYNREHPDKPLPLMSPHGFRHGWSTVAAELGVSDAVRMNRLDQSTLQINRRYTHAQQAASAEAARAVSDAMFADSLELGGLGR
jgi:integrase